MVPSPTFGRPFEAHDFRKVKRKYEATFSLSSCFPIFAATFTSQLFDVYRNKDVFSKNSFSPSRSSFLFKKRMRAYHFFSPSSLPLFILPVGTNYSILRKFYGRISQLRGRISHDEYFLRNTYNNAFVLFL